MKSGNVPGLAVAAVGIGGFLIWTGIRDVSVTDGLRSLLRGQTPTEGTQTPSTTGATLSQTARTKSSSPGGLSGKITPGSNASIAVAARKYMGTPYRWGGSSPETGFDCSGLVQYVLQHDMGMTGVPRVTGQFLVWSGAQTVGRKSCSAGDLVCWPGHIGIAISNTRMIHAPSTGDAVKESNIWSVPAPSIRRVK